VYSNKYQSMGNFENVSSVHHALVFPCDRGRCNAMTTKGSRCKNISEFVDFKDDHQCYLHLSHEKRKVQLFDSVLTQDNTHEYKFIRDTIMEKETEKAAESCAICMSNIYTNSSLVLGVCGHRFHEKCITEWIFKQQKNSCPCCRATVIQEDEYEYDDLYSVMDVLWSPEARECVREDPFFIQRAYTYDGAVSIAMALTLTV